MTLDSFSRGTRQNHWTLATIHSIPAFRYIVAIPLNSVSTNHLSFRLAFSSARKRAGLTQAQLAESSGLSRRSIIRWESGSTSPWIPELRQTFPALGLSDQEGRELIGLLDTTRGIRFAAPDVAEIRGRIYRTARCRLGLSVAEVASRVSCSPATLARWEAGTVVPDSAESSRLESVLGMDVREVNAAFRSEIPTQPEDDPWHVDYYRLMDARVTGRLACRPPDRMREERLDYSWWLTQCGRFREAAELIEGSDFRDLEENRPTDLLARAAAGAFDPSPARRRVAIGILDSLEAKPLRWETVAVRFDLYAGALADRRSRELTIRYMDRCRQAGNHCARSIRTALASNASRIFLRWDRPDLALERFEGFSDLSPLHMASEATLLASIKSALGNRRDERHWQSLADDLVARHGLHDAFERWVQIGWQSAWSLLPCPKPRCDRF